MKQKKIYGIFLLFTALFISIIIMIIPTFYTKHISRQVKKTEFDLPFILDSKKDIELLFFGYSGCSDICTPRLHSIDKLYKSMDEEVLKRVGVMFLDISIPSDNTLPKRFAEYFNKNFKGIYLSQNIIRDYTKIFEVYFSPSLIEKSEYDHTTNLYIVKKSNNLKMIRYIYNAYPYDFKQIKLDIEGLIDE